MKRSMIMILLLLSLTCAVLAESGSLLSYNANHDWFAMQAADGAPLPEGLTERETEIYRAGYANGHYDALHPAYVAGLYVLNTKTKKFHLSNCMATVTIDSANRLHSSLTPEELIAEGYKPCGQCHPER